MMAAFHDAATAWAAAGVAPLPITADGKRPLVKQPDAFGRRGALQLAAKPRFANAAVGFWCGHFNRLTVADVDSAPTPNCSTRSTPSASRPSSCGRPAASTMRTTGMVASGGRSGPTRRIP